MGERKNWSDVLHLQMCGAYDVVLLSSILRQKPLSPNNRHWKKMNMSRAMLMILLMPLEDMIHLANSSIVCHSNAVAGQVLKKVKNG
jgi:hypothetical protein